MPDGGCSELSFHQDFGFLHVFGHCCKREDKYKRNINPLLKGTAKGTMENYAFFLVLICFTQEKMNGITVTSWVKGLHLKDN